MDGAFGAVAAVAGVFGEAIVAGMERPDSIGFLDLHKWLLSAF